MSRYIIMKKIAENDKSVFYDVSDKASGLNFYVEIDKQNNRAKFYDSSLFHEPKMTFDFKEKEGKKQKGNLDIPTDVIGKTLHKIKLALEEKNFLDIISYVHC